VDRNFFAAHVLISLARDASSCHWLIRAKTNQRWRVLERLGPNDYRVEMAVSSEARRTDPSLPLHFEVRAIRYHRRGFQPQWLLTSMLDAEAYPASEIQELYHERWEIELGYDEIKTEMLDREETIRSKSPERIRQEIWGILLAYNLVRLERERVADEAKVEPTRISFITALHLICDEWLWCASASPGAIPRHLRNLRASLLRFVLPPRRPEHRNPRAVEVKPSSYPRTRRPPTRRTARRPALRLTCREASGEPELLAQRRPREPPEELRAPRRRRRLQPAEEAQAVPPRVAVALPQLGRLARVVAAPEELVAQRVPLPQRQLAHAERAREEQGDDEDLRDVGVQLQLEPAHGTTARPRRDEHEKVVQLLHERGEVVEVLLRQAAPRVVAFEVPDERVGVVERDAMGIPDRADEDHGARPILPRRERVDQARHPRVAHDVDGGVDARRVEVVGGVDEPVDAGQEGRLGHQRVRWTISPLAKSTTTVR
jgi:hypothetical protein